MICNADIVERAEDCLEARNIGTVNVRGKSEPLKLYEVFLMRVKRSVKEGLALGKNSKT